MRLWLWLVIGGTAAVTAVAVVLSKLGGGGLDVKHAVGAGGWVEADPAELAASKAVSNNVYALASMGQSEGGGDQALRQAVMWCARNEATRRGTSVFKLLTRAGKKVDGEFQPHPSNGAYAPQNVGPRYASTRKAPSDGALADAREVLSGAIDDPTDGCTQFDAPGVQDSLLGVVEGYLKGSEEVAENRRKNSDEVRLPGITSTRFWRPRS